MENFDQYIIGSDRSIREVLTRINELKGATLFVTKPDGTIIGSVNDGDVRRALLAGASMEDSAERAANQQFRSLKAGDANTELIREFRKIGLRYVPVLNEERQIAEILDLSVTRSYLPLDALIMAGGKGKRLKPLTDSIPKPLLKVGDKPILEHNLDRLAAFGIKSIKLSVNYLGEQIVDYFGDGTNKGMDIEYIKEDQPLGTLGSAVLTDQYRHDYILVMNSDLLTDIDLSAMMDSVINSKADMTIATIPYTIDVPYAVLERKDDLVTGFEEKPSYTYHTNAGIYILKKEHLSYVSSNAPYNATDLIDDLIKDGKRVTTFPILGYWLDIGKHEDFERAQRDINHIKL